MIYQDINIELIQAINNSAYNQIDYDYLLANNPAQIRIEEQKVANLEEPLIVPTTIALENISIPSRENNRTIPLRTYRPKEQNNMPVLLYFHGGAFIYGSPEQYDFIFTELALQTKALIISVDYRLAPEHPFPAALNDAYDALLWLSHHATQLGGNKNNIIVGGSSAGGAIAASLAQMAKDKKEVTIKHQYLLYPPLDNRLTSTSMQELSNAPMQTKKAAEYMWHYYLGDNAKNPPKYAVPLLTQDYTNLPPATIIMCEFDPLKDEAKQYANQLTEANVPVNMLEVKGATHAFDFFNTTLSQQFLQQQITLFKNIFKQQ
ncbi:MAG: alpha/beta hydrolase [Flavobacteriaceae bacterium]|jgi:acetyl esterase|nr:alpha/beta hydrolase [Flavobacteriaceae bacterium]